MCSSENKRDTKFKTQIFLDITEVFMLSFNGLRVLYANKNYPEMVLNHERVSVELQKLTRTMILTIPGCPLQRLLTVSIGNVLYARLVAVFWEVLGTLGGETQLEEIGPWGRTSSPRPLALSLSTAVRWRITIATGFCPSTGAHQPWAEPYGTMSLDKLFIS